MEFLEKFAEIVRLHSLSVAVAIVATAFAVFGGSINSIIRLVTKKMHFIVRFAFYILVYAFGIGILSAQAVSFLRKFLLALLAPHLLLFVAIVFLLLCFMAKKQRQI
jgi:uncharacterized membrane protein YfcA